MQIKEFEALTLKECLQQVRDSLGPEAVILETRKLRKGGMLGVGSHDAVCIVAATGISVKDDFVERDRAASRMAIESEYAVAVERPPALPAAEVQTDASRTRTSEPVSALPQANPRKSSARTAPAKAETQPTRQTPVSKPTSANKASTPTTANKASAVAAARSAYGRAGREQAATSGSNVLASSSTGSLSREEAAASNFAAASQNNQLDHVTGATPIQSSFIQSSSAQSSYSSENEIDTAQEFENSGWIGTADTLKVRQSAQEDRTRVQASLTAARDAERVASLERTMDDIRASLAALQREQRESEERTVSAVVSAVMPAVTAASNAVQLALGDNAPDIRFPAIYEKLLVSGVGEQRAQALLNELPDLTAWSEAAQIPLALSALRDLIGRRICSSGPIVLTPGRLKAVALIGPTGVGKTTTIAKIAAHFALVENKRVALITVDTYRVAAVEQLRIYSELIEIPLAVAYNLEDVLPIVAHYEDYDLLLIDTAGRSQKNIAQVGEIKSLLEAVNCETHLVMSAQFKEQDMVEMVRRFSEARVDRLLFTKLDETDSYGTLLNVAEETGIPLSYLTTGQKVPEDIEIADGGKLAGLMLDDPTIAG